MAGIALLPIRVGQVQLDDGIFRIEGCGFFESFERPLGPFKFFLLDAEIVPEDCYVDTGIVRRSGRQVD